jgi:hypothetical protein
MKSLAAKLPPEKRGRWGVNVSPTPQLPVEFVNPVDGD